MSGKYNPDLNDNEQASYNEKYGDDPRLIEIGYKNDECFDDTPTLDKLILEVKADSNKPLSPLMLNLIEDTKQHLTNLGFDLSPFKPLHKELDQIRKERAGK